MKIVIAGGTGLIGSTLVASFVQDGHQVVILSRSPEKYAGQFPSSVQLLAWDGKTAGDWASSLNGADVVINLAGENIGARPWTDARKQAIRDSRVNAGKALVNAIESVEQKPRLLVQSSAVGYYGITGDKILPESSPAGEDFLAQVCVVWEDATAPVEKMGVRRVILRTGIVLSTREGALPRMLLPMRLFVGGALGTGKQWFPWIHINDEIAAIRFLIENEQTSGAYNLAAPAVLTNAAFTKAMGQVMRRPSLMFVPGFALKLVLGEMSIIVLEGQRVTSQRLQDAGFHFQFSEAAPALADVLDKKL